MNVRVPAAACYRLSACLGLAEAYGSGRWKRARELRRVHVPPAMQRQALRQLVQRGLARAKAGRAGGYRLSRPPNGISLWDVLGDDGRPVAPGANALGLTLRRAAAAFRRELEDVSLGSLVPGRPAAVEEQRAPAAGG